MLRRLHGLAGLVLAIPLIVVAVSGTVLSLEPVGNHLTYPTISRGVSVASLAEAVVAQHPGADTIKLRDDGAVTVSYDDGAARGVAVVDPATGADLGPYQPSHAMQWVIDLHRALLAGDTGRIIAAGLATMMTALSVTGLMLLARRLGGYAKLLRPIKGSASERWHSELGRLALVGLLLSSLSGLWMSAATFGLIPTAADSVAVVTASGGPLAPLMKIPALAAADVADLKQLTLALADDTTTPIDLITTAGETQIDGATGAVLADNPASVLDRIGDVLRTLHTGRGAWALGLILGLMAATVPAFAGTGLVMWLRHRTPKRDANQVAAADADTIVLVGSEGGSTWGFAKTLTDALTAAGHAVHVAAMNEVGPEHLAADRLLILTATYGDGAAPASATSFLARLDRLGGRPEVAVLGFGDRGFPHFCAYAHDVAAALSARGFPELLPLKRIDRQSGQEFAAWGDDLGAMLGHPLTLEHVAERPKTQQLTLISREDYGDTVGAPVAILRFGAADGGRLPDFAAGDLVGVVAPDTQMPRFYSLASSRADGFLEICVRLRPGGVCSSHLHGLEPGDRIAAFVRDNPNFRPAAGVAPLILIGAGAGIGPLAGFIRANRRGRPVHLYWGGRSPASDFLYEHELAEHLAAERLTKLRTAFSRLPGDAAYVQDRLAADAPVLRALVVEGGQILVCGGRDMAAAVKRTLEAVLRPLGVDLARLKEEGRYVEDVY
jgi:sulfite reductase (NADPH) flavoprotein alpha-component